MQYLYMEGNYFFRYGILKQDIDFFGTHGFVLPGKIFEALMITLDNVDRFKNDDVIGVDYTSDISTLTVESAQMTDTGYYRCRASNDDGAIYSTIATVLVKGTVQAFTLFIGNLNSIFTG